MVPISKDIHPLLEYTKRDFQIATERILRHQQSIIKFSSSLSGANGAIFNGKYTLSRVSHSYFSNCFFQDAFLDRVAGPGSIFSHVNFENTDLNSSGFQNSTITHCKYENCNLKSCNMSNCYISDTDWIECNLQGFNLSGSYLKNCAILHNKSNPGNLGDCYFDKVHFEEHRLTNMNLEFSHFKAVTMENVVLPFSQMPYIFGGLTYLLNTGDNISISSHINAKDRISIEEYVEVLYDMIVFYSYKKEYFPLANILLALQYEKEAWQAVFAGIVMASNQRDFRMCKYFCELITSEGNITAKQMQSLYQALIKNTPIQILSEAQYYEYNKYIPEIRTMLLDNPNKQPHGTLILTTNISVSESENISMLLSCLDYFIHLDCCPLEKPSIEITHNSPLAIIIHLCSAPITILSVMFFILTVTSKVCKMYNDIAQAIIATQNIAENNNRKAKDELENIKLYLEIEHLKLENDQLKNTISQHGEKITQSGIIITRADVLDCDFNPYKWL